MRLLFLYLDHVAALGLSLAVTDHVEKLVVGLMGFLVPRLWAEENALCRHVAHGVNIDHLAPDLVFLEGGDVIKVKKK